MAKNTQNDPFDPYDPNANTNPTYDDTPYGRPGVQPEPTHENGSTANPPAGKGPGFWQDGKWMEYPVLPGGHYGDGGAWIPDPDTPPAPPDTNTPTPPTTPPPDTTTPAGTGSTEATKPPSVLDAFTPSGTTGGADAGAGGTSTSGGTNTTTTTTTPTNPPATDKPVSPYEAALRAQILRLLGGPTAEQIGAEAGNSEPVNAFRNSMLRDFGVARAQAAEESGLNGTQGSGGFEGRVEGLRQAAGEATAKYAGQYTQTAMENRRAELSDAMKMASQAGQFEESQWLELEIAKIDQQIRQEQNANTRYATEINKLLGMSDVDLRRYLGQLQNDTSMYGINTSRRNLLDQLGLGYAELDSSNYWNQTDRENAGGK